MTHDHPARPSDDAALGDRCKDCRARITWIGPGSTDWIHLEPAETRPMVAVPDLVSHDEAIYGPAALARAAAARTPAELELGSIEQRLKEAIIAADAAEARMHKWALLAIAKAVRGYDDDAMLRLEASDQGPHLAWREIRKPTGETADSDDLQEQGWGQLADDLDYYTSCLRDESSAWPPFIQDWTEHRHIGHQHEWLLDLDKVLACEGDSHRALATPSAD